MSRLTGPDASMRTVYLPNGQARAQGLSATLYTDSGLTAPADILDLSGAPIAGSTVVIDAYSDLPVVQYPDGVDVLYTNVSGGPVQELPARHLDRIRTINAEIATLSAEVGGGGGSSIATTVAVTADGVTDAAPAIQTVLSGLASGAHGYDVVVQPSTKGAPIYLNSHVQITTSYTRVRFAGPVLFGTGCDPDGNGCLSILGSVASTLTVTAGATRGSSQVTVAAAGAIATRQLVRIRDNDTSGGATAGYKGEMAEVVDVSGTTILLDHPLHHTYTGTVQLDICNDITGSGFSDVQATFTGQQAAGTVYIARMLYGRACYFRNIHLRGDRNNSWSREAVNVRYSYRSVVEDSSANFGWDFAVGSTYDYGFSADGATACQWVRCYASNTRHAYTLDKGSAGCKFAGCTAENGLASQFDVHGNWCRDNIYIGCTASASTQAPAATDTQRHGFLAGNTTFYNGTLNISFIDCVARNFTAYTTASSTTGEGAGFGVADGSVGTRFVGCRVYDSQQGILILSTAGLAAIADVAVLDCDFDNITDGPISLRAGVAPGDVNGAMIDNCRFIGGQPMKAVLLQGTSSNTISDIQVSNCKWQRTSIASGQYPLDARYVDNLTVMGNVFNRTLRGVSLLNCAAAAVDSTFVALGDTDAAHTVFDGGGNTNAVVTARLVGYTPTSWSTAVTSTGMFVALVPARDAVTLGTLSGATTINPMAGAVQMATLGAATVALTVGGGAAAGHDRLVLVLTQDGTGGRAVTWPSNVKWVGSAPTLQSAAAAVDVFTLLWDGTNWREQSRAGGGGSGGAGALLAANNLSDLGSVSTARTNLGLGGAALLAVGTTAGTVAAGSHSHAETDVTSLSTDLAGKLVKASNLSDVASAATALTNLGGVPASTVTAKGDLIVATASGTVSHLPAGVDGKFVVADSTQTTGLNYGTPAFGTSAPPAALGTSAVGSATTYTRSDHQHGSSALDASDYGLTVWNVPLWTATSSQGTATAGTLYVCKVKIPVAMTVTNVALCVGTGGATLTTGQCLAGLYSSAKALLSATGDQSGVWTSTGLKVAALGAAQAVPAGYVYVAWFSNGTTTPKMSRGGSSSIVNGGVAAANSFWATTSDTGLTTAMPSTLGTFTAAQETVFAAVS